MMWRKRLLQAFRGGGLIQPLWRTLWRPICGTFQQPTAGTYPKELKWHAEEPTELLYLLNSVHRARTGIGLRVQSENNEERKCGTDTSWSTLPP